MLQLASSQTNTEVLDVPNNCNEVTDAPHDTNETVVEEKQDDGILHVDITDDTTLAANEDFQATEKAQDQPSQLLGYNKIFGSELLS